MLEIQQGTKRYNGQEVLKDISLQFPDHQIHGLVGINGSGKTLILKALAGYLVLDEGVVRQGETVIRSQHNYIDDAGVVIENPQFISHLSLRENLTLLAKLTESQKDIDIDKWIELYRLETFQHTPFKHLSLGTKKKMALIQAFMHKPSVLILDEPMNALDEKSVELTRQLILEHKQKGLAIITSHNSQDIEALCDTVHVISEGRVIS